MLAEVCAGFVILGIAAYAVLGSADFGAGFWDLTAGGDRRGGALRGMIERSMAPVWEANHVWLIFVLVITWTAFPEVFGSIFSTLHIPLFLAAIGIIFRGTAFALRGQAATIREARVLGALFASASVLIPFFFGAVLGGIASGRVGVGNVNGDPIDSWLNPTSLLIGVIAVLTGAYLAAVYLAGDSVRAEQPELARAFRLRALLAGAASGAVSIGGLLVLRSDARSLFDGLTSGDGLAMVIVSALAGVSTLVLVWTERYGLARVTSALAVVAIVVGWALAQDPYLLPPSLTLDQAAAADAGDRDRGRPRHADPRPVAVVPLPPRPQRPARPELRTSRPALPHMTRLPAIALACLVVGVVVMVVLELTWLGVILLFVFIVTGIFAIADPAFLADDDADQ
jgi:cytochrome d ubiquinol oxidase subunit II